MTKKILSLSLAATFSAGCGLMPTGMASSNRVDVPSTPTAAHAPFGVVTDMGVINKLLAQHGETAPAAVKAQGFKTAAYSAAEYTEYAKIGGALPNVGQTGTTVTAVGDHVSGYVVGTFYNWVKRSNSHMAGAGAYSNLTPAAQTATARDAKTPLSANWGSLGFPTQFDVVIMQTHDAAGNALGSPNMVYKTTTGSARSWAWGGLANIGPSAGTAVIGQFAMGVAPKWSSSSGYNSLPLFVKIGLQDSFKPGGFMMHNSSHPVAGMMNTETTQMASRLYMSGESFMGIGTVPSGEVWLDVAGKHPHKWVTYPHIDEVLPVRLDLDMSKWNSAAGPNRRTALNAHDYGLMMSGGSPVMQNDPMDPSHPITFPSTFDAGQTEFHRLVKIKTGNKFAGGAVSLSDMTLNYQVIHASGPIGTGHVGHK